MERGIFDGPESVRFHERWKPASLELPVLWALAMGASNERPEMADSRR